MAFGDREQILNIQNEGINRVDVNPATLIRRLIAGTSINISPSGGVGDVTVNLDTHVLASPIHTANGLSIGWVLRASGGTTFAWAQLQHTDLGNVSVDQHHAQLHAAAHAVGSGDALSVGVPVNIGTANAEGSATNFARRDHVHNHPSGLGADLHHTRLHTVISTSDHSASGLTTGWVLKATGATTFAWGNVDRLDDTTLVGTNRRITFDTNDYLEYLTTEDRWLFKIGGVTQYSLDAGTFVISSVYGTRLAGTNRYFSFDVGWDLIAFDTTENSYQFWIGGEGASKLTITSSGLLQPASTYHCFGATLGEGSYGLRDSAGTMQFKHSGGTWTNLGAGGAGNPAGNDGEVQFNDNGVFGGANLHWDKTNRILTGVIPSPVSNVRWSLIRTRDNSYTGDTLTNLLAWHWDSTNKQIGFNMAANATYESGSWVAPKQNYSSAILAVVATTEPGAPGEIQFLGRKQNAGTSIPWIGPVKVSIQHTRITALGWKSVKDYASVADAIADLSDSDTLYFPPGTYNLSSTISTTKNISIRGAGVGKTILKFTGCNGIHIRGGSIRTTSEITDLSIFTTNAGGFIALDLDGNNTEGEAHSQFHLNRLEIRGEDVGTHYWNIGIDLFGGYNSEICNVRVMGKYIPNRNANPWPMDKGIYLHDHSIDVNIVNARVLFATYGLHVGTGRCEGTHALNFQAIHCDYGIYYAYTSQKPLINVYNGHLCVHLKGVYLNNNCESVISGLVIYAFSTTSSAWRGIHVDSNCTRISIANNIIRDNWDTSYYGTAIEMAGDECNIIGNIVRLSSGTGLNLTAASSYCIAEANVFRPCATAITNSGANNQFNHNIT